jgi:hypothetical protein
MDDQTGFVGEPFAEVREAHPWQLRRKLLRRVNPVGHFGSPLAGRPRRTGPPLGAFDRRRHEPELGWFRAARWTREHGVLWEYIDKYGRMVDTCTDRDSMFTVTRRRKETEQQRRRADRLTQIGRAAGTGDRLDSRILKWRQINRLEAKQGQM